MAALVEERLDARPQVWVAVHEATAHAVQRSAHAGTRDKVGRGSQLGMDRGCEGRIVLVVYGCVGVAPCLLAAAVVHVHVIERAPYHQMHAARESAKTMRVKTRRVSSQALVGPRALFAQSVARKKRTCAVSGRSRVQSRAARRVSEGPSPSSRAVTSP